MPIYEVLLGDFDTIPLFQVALRNWFFRGQANVDWTIRSTFERASSERGLSGSELLALEVNILRKFRRRAHHYLEHLPAPDDWIGWQSLIRHHGGPTRIVDFTKNLLVAAFFAVENAESDAAIWAVNATKLAKDPAIAAMADRMSGTQDPDPLTVAFSQLLISGHSLTEGVTVLDPFELNQRTSIQQGSFLAPNVLDIPFLVQLEHAIGQSLSSSTAISLENLWNPSANQDKPDDAVRMVKIIISKRLTRNLRKYLQMNNVDASTLFPGLDGFARSLFGDVR